ncbi:hypothetical protein T439DRAFT_360881 [Meredithblackwellia eburnea MCA 4105]
MSPVGYGSMETFQRRHGHRKTPSADSVRLRSTSDPIVGQTSTGSTRSTAWAKNHHLKAIINEAAFEWGSHAVIALGVEVEDLVHPLFRKEVLVVRDGKADPDVMNSHFMPANNINDIEYSQYPGIELFDVELDDTVARRQKKIALMNHKGFHISLKVGGD